MSDFSYSTDTDANGAKQLGLIVLQSDETIEDDFRRMFAPSDVSLLVSRVPSSSEVTQDTLAQMQSTLPAAAGLFPRPVTFDVVGYGCTSGTSVIGAPQINQLVRSGCTTAQVTEPVSALLAACRHLGLQQIAFLSPYIESVSDTLRSVIAESGVEIPVFGSFNESREEMVARMDRKSVRDAAIELGSARDVDAVFLSCTNLKTMDVIADIEAELSMPVLSSNLVLAWHMARLGGIPLKGSPSETLRH